MLDLKAQYTNLRTEIDAAVARVLESGAFVLGPEMRALEQEVAEACGVEHGVALANGTDALNIAVRALGLKPGDEVITTPFTFFAPAEVIALHGARPVWVDIDPASFNIDPAQVEAAITPRTVGILPVHLFGQPADLTALSAIANAHGLWLLEDNCQAVGARHRGRASGSFGRATAISFYPTKNIGAYGDGGMLVTPDAAVAEHARRLRNHGQGSTYLYEECGYNSRLDELQAAILRVKMKRLAEWGAARRERAKWYDSALRSLPVKRPAVDTANEHVFHQYTIRVPDRDSVAAALAERGIGAKVYYPAPLHTQPAMVAFGGREGQCPAAEQASREVLSLPIYPELTRSQVDAVAAALRAALGK
jgi:dTDP-4-amino-4,6-dideoxygalactose transaminase